MNSNLKLLSAGLLVAVLAGCGGGGGGEMTEPELTPEEACLAGDGVVYENNTCKTAEDLRKEGRDAEAEARDKADADKKADDDAKAAQKAAETLRAALASAISGEIDSTTTDSPGTDYFVTVAAAGPTGLKNNDAYKAMSVSVTGKAFNKQYTAIAEGVLAIHDGTSFENGVLASRVSAPAFGTSGAKTHTANGVTSTGTARFTTSGSLHGVAGTYTCTGTCTSSFDADDVLVLGGTSWTFTPSNPSASVMDGTAVQYGWWTNDLGKTDAVARVYYGPKDMNVVAYTGGGKATYTGDAVGQYAIHRGAGSDNDSGAFTADVTLNANFGTGAEISGKVDGFMGDDGMARDWEVELRAATITSGAWAPAGTPDNASDNEAMTVWTMGGVKGSAAGSWRGQTYGPGATPDVTLTPAAVAGAFSAEHGNIGNMIGSFGADVDD